ncbi:MAG: hypothetical protein IJH64_01245 [Oscillospiraceae bacterium]|nr:hypothetical protein [Oscillospiraceae bacterium]
MEVERLKTYLLHTGAIKDAGDCYKCCRNIKTGVLMAFNLHTGKVEKEIPECTVVFNGNDDSDASIKTAFQGKSFYSADNTFRHGLEKDTYRQTKLIQIEYNKSFFKGRGDGSLSEVEQFVIDVLLTSKEIKEFRRGDAEKRECDIVDEYNGRQIEIVSFFDEKIPNSVRFKSDLSEEQALALENCDFGFNVVSDAVIKKFTKKEYTDKYEKELAIYFFGGSAETGRKITAIEKELETHIEKIRNNYRNIHLIIHDPLDAESVIYCSKDRCESFPDSCSKYSPVTRVATVKSDEIQDDKEYFLLKENIFNNEEKQGSWLTGHELKEYELL